MGKLATLKVTFGEVDGYGKNYPRVRNRATASIRYGIRTAKYRTRRGHGEGHCFNHGCDKTGVQPASGASIHPMREYHASRLSW